MPTRRSTYLPARACWFATILLIPWGDAGDSWGAEAAETPPAASSSASPPPRGAADPKKPHPPEFWVVGFQDDDQSGDCPQDAPLGACVEYVSFDSLLRQAWDTPPGQPFTRTQRAYWRALGHAYEHLWEDLAYRWNEEGDPVKTVLQDVGVTGLPTLAELWSRSTDGVRRTSRKEPGQKAQHPGHRNRFSLPIRESVISAGDGGGEAGALFPALKMKGPPGAKAWTRNLVVASGRFAEHLEYKGERATADLMDGGIEYSGPFVEEMFHFEKNHPFWAERPFCRFDSRPSWGPGGYEMDDSAVCKDARPPIFTVPIGKPGMSLAEEIAISEFRRFRRRLEVTLTQYMMEEYTDVQMYVLAALELMSIPPPQSRENDARLTELGNIANPGEADKGRHKDEGAKADPVRTEQSGLADFKLHYENLPDDVVRDELENSYYPDFWKQTRAPTQVDARVSERSGDIDNPFLGHLLRCIENDPTIERSNYLKPQADRVTRNAPAGTSVRELNKWKGQYVEEYAQARRAFDLMVPKLALQAIVDPESCARGEVGQGGVSDSAKKDVVETDLLRRHLQYDLGKRIVAFQAQPGSPNDMADATRQTWTSVLAAHGVSVAPTSYRRTLKGVVPSAVCTVREGEQDSEGDPKEFGQPVVKQISLDIVFAAPDLDDDRGSHSMEVGSLEPLPVGASAEVLWSARDKLPFIMLDDPDAVRRAGGSTVVKLVGLPDGAALYRARWMVWSGWHLFWGVEPLGVPSAETPGRPPGYGLWNTPPAWHDLMPRSSQMHSVVLFTGAVCEDTVLIQPELVPTMLRAALLSGDFRTPVPWRKHDTRRDARENPGREGVVDNVEKHAATGSSPGSADAFARSASARVKSGGADQEETTSDAALYLKDVMLNPLRGKAGTPGEPLLLVTYDGETTYRRMRQAFRRPHTPYLLERRRIWGAWGDQSSSKGVSHSASGRALWTRTRRRAPAFVYLRAWINAIEPGDGSPPILLSPGYHTDESVTSRGQRPRWRQRKTTDWTIRGAGGVFPVRAVQPTCNASVSTVSCAEGLAPELILTSGFTADFGVLATRWVRSRHRVGWEAGPVLRLDLLTGGPGLLFWNSPFEEYKVTWDDEASEELEYDRFAVVPAPQAGFELGVRFAPTPRSLEVRPVLGRRPWGLPRTSGGSRWGRVQGGLDAVGLVGPGFNGTELRAGTEVWAGWSIRNNQAPGATLTPFSPGLLIGPYLSTSVGWLLIADEDRALEVSQVFSGADVPPMWMITFGVRGHIQIRPRKSGIPEAP